MLATTNLPPSLSPLHSPKDSPLLTAGLDTNNAGKDTLLDVGVNLCEDPILGLVECQTDAKEVPSSQQKPKPKPKAEVKHKEKANTKPKPKETHKVNDDRDVS